jgi:mannose-1-phosphate guanylyltransferase
MYLLKLGPNVAIGPNAIIGKGVRVRDSIVLEGVEIKVVKILI